MFKKIICAFLITTAMLSFVACTDNKNENSNETQPTEMITETPTAPKAEPATEAETEPATEAVIDNNIYLEDMVGKSFLDLFDEGYVYINHYNMEDGKECLFDVKMDNADSHTMKLIKKLDGKTVKELHDNNISIGYALNDSEEYTFFTVLGSVQVNFKIQGGTDVIKKYAGTKDTNMKNMTELQSLTLSEVELDGITYTVKVNEPVDKSVIDDLNSIMFDDATEATEPVEPTEAPDPTLPTEPEKTLETVLKDYTIAKFYYTPIPEDFLG